MDQDRGRVLHDGVKEGTNFGKMRTLVDHLRDEGDPGFRRVEDRAAVARLVDFEAAPKDTAVRVRKYLRAAFRRLYYQRNYVMHSAKFDSVSLAATTRYAPMLVAAGVDQMVNASFSKPPVSPLALAVRADVELAFLGKPGARDYLTLLA